MSNLITKGLIGKEDIQFSSGDYPETFTRVGSLGGLITMTKLPNLYKYKTFDIDAQEYGDKTFTQATIQAALTAIGTTNKATLLLRHGIWVISSNIDWSAYTNVMFKIVPGAVISHGAFTMDIPNLDAGLYQVFSGTGAVILSGMTKVAYPEWFAVNTVPGTTDMSDAIAASLVAVPTTKLSPTTYKVTKTLYILAGHSIIGKNKGPSGTTQSGITQEPLTKIIFDPTSELDLFDITTLGGNSYVSKVFLGGIHIIGNTTGGVTFSRYAINSKAAQSVFENMGIEQFQDGIYINFTMTNNYRNIVINNMSHAGLYASFDYNTSDVFDNVIVRASPWGAILQRAYAFRFNSCLWEELSIGGVDIYKECSSLQFIANYAENTPSTVGGTNYGMFYVYKHGTTRASGNTSIIGGWYHGADFGSFLDVGETALGTGVSVVGADAEHYKRGIRADATDTSPSSIYLAGTTFSSIITNYTNDIKNGVSIIYGVSQTGAGAVNLPIANAYQQSVNLLEIKAVGGGLVGSAYVTGYSDALLADDGIVYLTNFGIGVASLILVTVNDGSTKHEAGIFSVAFVGGATSIVKIIGTPNTAITDSDTNLCVYPSGVSVYVKNRLGVAVSVKVVNIF